MKERLLAVLLCACILVSVACSKKDNAVEEISKISVDDDTRWYYSELIKAGEEFAGNTDSSIPVMICNHTKVFYSFFDELTNEPINYLYVFSQDSDEEFEINIDDYSPDGMCNSLECCYYDASDAFAIVRTNGINEIKTYRIDKRNKAFVDEKIIEFNETYCDSVNGLRAIKKLDTYICFSYSVGYRNYSGLKRINESGETCYEITLDDYVRQFTVLDDGTVVAIMRDSNSQSVYSGYVVRIDEHGNIERDNSISDEMLLRCMEGRLLGDGCAYIKGRDMKLYQYDFSTGEETVVLDYNYVDANMSELNDYMIEYYSDSYIIYHKDTYYLGEDHQQDVTLELKLSDNNPNVGKKILYAAPSDTVSYMQGENIRDFNSKDYEYFVYVIMDYSFYYISHNNLLMMNQDLIYNSFDIQSAILTTLKQDISTGDGPDILIDFGEYEELNSDDWLLNITDVKEELSEDDYFANIIESFVNNGKIYQIPLSAMIVGIYAKKMIDNPNKIGVSFEEYDSFVRNCCNFNDPIANNLTRDDYLRSAFAYFYYEFHDENGKLMLDNSDFRDMCEYALRLTNDLNIDNIDRNQYVYMYSLVNDLSSNYIKDSGYQLYGLPSAESKGPAIIAQETIGITKCCSNVDFSKEFIRNALSYEVQICSPRNPINILAFDSLSYASVDKANELIEKEYYIENCYDYEIINEYKSYIQSANSHYAYDVTAFSIMMDELQPYFSGLKSIDEVIPVIESRVNMMIEEKK